MREKDTGRVCDNCGSPVLIRGVKEREYVHAHGSVFCMVTRATIDGRMVP